MNKLLHLKDKSPDKTRKLNRRNVLWKTCLTLSLCLTAFTNMHAYPDVTFTWNQDDIIEIIFKYYPDGHYYWVGEVDSKKNSGIFYSIDGGHQWKKLLSFYSQGLANDKNDIRGMKQMTHNGLCVFSRNDDGNWNRLNSGGDADIDNATTTIYRHGGKDAQAELVWIIPEEVKQASSVKLHFKENLKGQGTAEQYTDLTHDPKYNASISSSEFTNDKKLKLGYTTSLITGGYIYLSLIHI